MESKPFAWHKDIAAGALASIVNLPICLASGVLAFAPLGPSYAAMGAAAGLCGAIVAGAVSSIVATSSFITTTPRVGTSLVLASLIVALTSNSAVANDQNLSVIAVFLCVALGGLWQSAFALAGVARIIKFTPYPVLVGFLNGVAVLIALSQLRPYFLISADTSNLTLFDKPFTFALLLFVAALMLLWPTFARIFPKPRSLTKVPALPTAFFGGIAAFYLVKEINPTVDLGSTVGHVSFESPLLSLVSFEVLKHLAPLGWQIVAISLIVAIVATIDTLFVFRATQNVSDIRVAPVRDLFAQGLGSFASAIAGGITGSASTAGTTAAFRVGARTLLSPLSAALILLALSVLFPSYLAGIPTVVLSGILLGVAVLMFDRWTIQVVSETLKGSARVDRLRSFYDLIIVLIVMSLTIFYSVIAGVIAGCLLAALVFVINMSRPVVRRVLTGSDVQSKRLRPTNDITILRDTGSQRTVLQLEGVLFFGNADDLSIKVKSLFRHADMVTLDMRGITDIDVSGANILSNLIGKSRELNKELLFCDVPDAHFAKIKNLALKTRGTDELIKPDLDCALEWMEERSLILHAEKRSHADVLALSEIDFLAGIEGSDLARLREVLTYREFTPGEMICREGDEGDRMWLLAKGSVSVRLTNGRDSIRIASLARGTTLGEMSLVESARRSASIVADEPVVCYELLLADFTNMLAHHPGIATKLLSNLSRELSRRLRRTSEDLRNRN